MTRSTRPDRRALGIAGENTACLVVEEEGLRVIERNWRDGPHGPVRSSHRRGGGAHQGGTSTRKRSGVD